MPEKFPKVINPGELNWPKFTPLYLERNKLTEVDPIIAAKNVLQVRCSFQWLTPSSKANKTPPTGAPKAAATPAAVPAAINSDLDLSFLKCSNILNFS